MKKQKLFLGVSQPDVKGQHNRKKWGHIYNSASTKVENLSACDVKIQRY